MRLQRGYKKAKRTENYWISLTAPYTEYGFDAVISHKNSDDSDESNAEDEKRKKRQKKIESKKQKQAQIRENIKKRVKRDSSLESLPSPNKRRKLNNDKTERILSRNEDDDDSKKELETETPIGSRLRYSANKRRNIVDEDEEDVDLRKESSTSLSVSSDVDIYGMVKDSPFTPFADKSRVFSGLMGNTEDLFKNLQHPMSSSKLVKKRLNFSNHNNQQSVDDVSLAQRPPMNTFRIKWRYDDGFHSEKAQFVDIEAVRMDRAVQEFMENHAHSTVKLMSVIMTQMG